MAAHQTDQESQNNIFTIPYTVGLDNYFHLRPILRITQRGWEGEKKT